MNLELTLSRASSGHALIQFIAQQLTNEGNILILILNDSPTGDKHNTMWRLSRILYKKNW